MQKEKIETVSTGKTVGICVLTYFLVILSQVVALLAGQGVNGMGAPMAVGSIVSAVLYLALALKCISFISRKIFKKDMETCRITSRISLKPVWAVSALVLPALVILMVTRTAGNWSITSMNAEELSYAIVDAAAYYGLAAGIVEEAMFRGVIMTVLEQRWNRYAAVIAPSVLFGLSHIIGADLDFLSTIQLIVAGSLVGILFSLVTLESGNIWNSALMHAVWNTLLVGGILHIGVSRNDLFIFNYTLDSRSFLVTGGDFGVEASVFAVIGYGIFILIAAWMLRRKRIKCTVFCE